MRSLDALTLSEQSAPSTPASGLVVVYVKSDGKLYRKDDAGAEYEVGPETLAAAVQALDDKVDLRTKIPVLTAKTSAFTVDATQVYCQQPVNISAGAFNITVPTPASLGLTEGDWAQFYMMGTSQATFIVTGSTVIRSRGGATKSAGQYAKMQLDVIEDSSNGEWLLTGDITT